MINMLFGFSFFVNIVILLILWKKLKLIKSYPNSFDWQSIETLPEIIEEEILLTDGKNVLVRYFPEFNRKGQCLMRGNIATHWMALPKPPKN